MDGEQIDQTTAKLILDEYKRYENILFAFDYLTNQEACDSKIQSSISTIELDEGFRESYMEIIERFFQLFESIHNYYKDFKNFIANVHEGSFIDYSFETLLVNQEAKRLLVESVYLFGVMLILQDRLIPAIVRERLVVCYIRYKGNNSSDFVNEVCKLVKTTGYSFNSKTQIEILPKNYP